MYNVVTRHPEKLCVQPRGNGAPVIRLTGIERGSNLRRFDARGVNSRRQKMISQAVPG